MTIRVKKTNYKVISTEETKSKYGFNYKEWTLKKANTTKKLVFCKENNSY